MLEPYASKRMWMKLCWSRLIYSWLKSAFLFWISYWGLEVVSHAHSSNLKYTHSLLKMIEIGLSAICFHLLFLTRYSTITPRWWWFPGLFPYFYPIPWNCQQLKNWATLYPRFWRWRPFFPPNVIIVLVLYNWLWFFSYLMAVRYSSLYSCWLYWNFIFLWLNSQVRHFSISMRSIAFPSPFSSICWYIFARNSRS